MDVIHDNKLPVILNTIITSIGCPHLASKPLLTELINEQVLDDLMTDMFEVFKETSASQDTEAPAAVFSKNEDILKYAHGYVINLTL